MSLYSCISSCACVQYSLLYCFVPSPLYLLMNNAMPRRVFETDVRRSYEDLIRSITESAGSLSNIDLMPVGGGTFHLSSNEKLVINIKPARIEIELQSHESNRACPMFVVQKKNIHEQLNILISALFHNETDAVYCVQADNGQLGFSTEHTHLEGTGVRNPNQYIVNCEWRPTDLGADTQSFSFNCADLFARQNSELLDEFYHFLLVSRQIYVDKLIGQRMAAANRH